MEEKILAILAKINNNIVTFEGDNLFDAGILDSLQAINIISALEDELDVEIDAEEVIEDNLKTKEAIVAMVKRAQR